MKPAPPYHPFFEEVQRSRSTYSDGAFGSGPKQIAKTSGFTGTDGSPAG